jgi:DNA invertase Pin-like site-specific DNA recombinase
MSANPVSAIFDIMLIGYGRVSTADQNPAHQIDALKRAGVDEDNVHIDTASGAKSSRPKLDLVLNTIARHGDTIVITRLDRLGRSMLHLVNLGADLRTRGIGLKVLEQGIDTDTAEGRAMFGMLSVLAEFQRELIIANTRDGLAAARARGRTGGRRPKLTADQIETAQRLYDEGRHTVQQIANILGVKRGTLYGHLDPASVGGRPRSGPANPADPAESAPSAPQAPPPPASTAAEAVAPVVDPAPVAVVVGEPVAGVATVVEDVWVAGGTRARDIARERMRARREALSIPPCPHCGNVPAESHAQLQQQQDLTISWLEPDPHRPDTVVERRHCMACQPGGQIAPADCGLCDNGPILVGDLAAELIELDRIPAPVRAWLLGHGWREHPRHGVICADHAE